MKALGIFLSFILIMILAFFTIGFTDSVPTPTAGTDAANQSDDLSQAVNISNSGLYATMLILIAAMVFSALLFMASIVTKRNRG